ncbi:hypothetical protein SELMODRAFT_179397 [Selaginella moellendorffii]|uniref:Serine incorporator n=1 Tax=Selaginella moellendorffii TaxID=88036 RepID=D8SFY1_SELML|nr:probable serine incorporator isoform X2 [Selaginella moellendorffii]EFJ16586.1 hypothetical protein SELMODRAFT_179397 [Selaginella moellendorffii]|eukprot:XP_002982341.1 probable serine incorporator isoform X2 [Selaginella moellendorffii]
MAWCFCCSCAGANQMPTRYIYAIIFLFTNLIAWVVRDYSREAFRTLRHFQGCYGVHTCLASEGVLRLSFGCFVFFAIMFVTTVGTSRIGGLRDGWHCGWWPLKFLLWILLMILPFFVPPAIIKVYGEIARFGAGVFLVIQLFSIVNFAYWWNEKWLAPENSRRCFLPMLIVTTLSYVFCLIGLVIMYVWFAPKPSCSLNIFFISWTLVLLLAMTLISLHPKVSAGLMTSGLISLYIVFLCWSAIMSEPRSEVCNTRPRQTGKADLLTVLSFFMGLVAIVFATFSTGADSNPFVPANPTPDPENQEIKRVPYSYGFFHFVFAVGSMYFAMLFVGWNLHQTMLKWSIDVGWASVWVKITNEWLAAGVYIWTMVSSVVSNIRQFS